MPRSAFAAPFLGTLYCRRWFVVCARCDVNHIIPTGAWELCSAEKAMKSSGHHRKNVFASQLLYSSFLMRAVLCVPHPGCVPV